METLAERLQQFAGGQIEVINEHAGAVTRGEILTAAIIGKNDVDCRARVTLKWFAKQEEDLSWVSYPIPYYTAGLMVYYTLMDMGVGRRLYLASSVMGELVTFYAKGDESLDPAQVIGLDVRN